MAYLTTASVMTLSVLESHSPTASLFPVVYFVYLWHIARSVCIRRASCCITLYMTVY